MSDRRLTPVTGRVAHVSVAADFPDREAVDGRPASVSVPVADLRAAPGGSRDRQVLYGESVVVLDEEGGWTFAILDRDGYVGWLAPGTLGAQVEATHFVSARASHLYEAPDMKAPESLCLSFGARLRIVGETGPFHETHDGRFVPEQHLRSLRAPFGDPVAVAQVFFGAPYLWGGNTVTGIDCSGLVQAAHLACGRACPGDSDLQESALGDPLPPDAATERGDLFFWPGHVAIAVDADTLIHANAHHMAVAYEPADAAIRRIEAQGGGPLRCRLRPPGA